MKFVNFPRGKTKTVFIKRFTGKNENIKQKFKNILNQVEMNKENNLDYDSVILSLRRRNSST